MKNTIKSHPAKFGIGTSLAALVFGAIAFFFPSRY
jgi:hypothetical protein